MNDTLIPIKKLVETKTELKEREYYIYIHQERKTKCVENFVIIKNNNNNN